MKNGRTLYFGGVVGANQHFAPNARRFSPIFPLYNGVDITPIMGTDIKKILN
jgi:hypothetical protein